ncbi:protein max-like [Cotesia typhae]|uniref:protein max-like n=1 Tax=Cotesia typhae TaxID=2053667 RepID=UPI003D686E0E
MSGNNIKLVEKYYKPNGELEIKNQKRAYHTMLEKKRRDGMKYHFEILQNTVNELDEDNKLAKSRMKVLKKTSDFIRSTEHRMLSIRRDILAINEENSLLESQLMSLGVKNFDLTEEDEEILDALDLP